MACEGCAIKFTLFKRKKQCSDCLRNYCTNCLIRCADRRLNCEKCRVFSQRPLVRSRLLEMRAKDLQHYLMVKKVSTRGCAEKEDLVNLIIQHANATDNNGSSQRSSSTHDDSPLMNAFRGLTSTIFTYSNPDIPHTMRQGTERQEIPTWHRTTAPDVNNTSSYRVPESRTSNTTSQADYSSSAPNSRSRRPPSSSRVHETTPTAPEEPTPIVSLPETENASSVSDTPIDIEIEEISDSDCSPGAGPEPLITEHDDSNIPVDQDTRSEMVTELLSHTGIVKLSDIHDPAGLEALNVKQLKDLLSINRVDFKGCVERSELLDRASRLWKQHAKSREDLEKLGLEDLCKICMDAPVECVMLECGHMATCTNCGKQLSECPICRQYVVRVVRTFRA